jgi:hypothetical protein
MARKAYLYSTNLILRWMVRLNIGVLLLLFAASPIVVPIFFNIANASGTTYYVDNCVIVGNDSNNGTSPSTPWLTVNKVNTSSFSAGDSILFKRTCTWREQLTVPSSGSAGNPITFGAYGSGVQPIISGANLLSSGWSLQSGNVWQASLTTQPSEVFFNAVIGTLETSIATITAANEWWWSSNVLYVYSTSNPGTAFTNPGIEASQRQYAIYSNQNYVTFSSLQLQGSNYRGFYQLGDTGITLTGIIAQYNYDDGIRIDAATNTLITLTAAAYNGANGIDIYSSPAVLLDHDTAHDNCQFIATNYTGGFKFVDVSRTATNMTVQYSQSYNNGLAQNSAAFSGGKGIWADTVGNGFTAQDNLVYNNRANGIDIDADNNSIVAYNVIYGNDGGIQVYPDNNSAAGNVVYGNTVYANNHSNYWGTSPGIFMSGDSTANHCINNIVKNNISTGQIQVTGQPNFLADGGCENDGTDGSGNVYTYNGFGPAASNFITWGGSNYSTYATWEAASGNCGSGGCSHSVQTDPNFNNPSGNDFTLQSTSPAIDAGTNLGAPYNMGLDPRSSFPWSTLDQGIYGSWEIGAFVYVPNLGSGNQTEPRYDFLNNSATSATSNHTIVFTLENSLDNTGGSSSDTLAFTFQSNFNLANITCGDINVATGTRFLFNVATPEPRTNCPNTTTSWGLLVNTASRTITITVPATVRTYVATGTIITVSIGSNANYQNQGTHWIVNPSDGSQGFLGLCKGLRNFRIRIGKIGQGQIRGAGGTVGRNLHHYEQRKWFTGGVRGRLHGFPHSVVKD